MRKTILKRAAALVLVLAVTAGLAPMALAYSCNQITITNTTDGHVDKILADLERQSFGSEEQRASVTEKVSYLLTESAFSAIDSGEFPYYNKNGYAGTVSDGSYSYTVNASGCYAYAKWASYVVYGSAGEQLFPKDENGNNITSVWSLSVDSLKDFIETNCQAGEHLRVDYVHSVCFLACDENGFYFSEYPGDGDPYIRLRYASYEDFLSAARSGSSLWVSDVSKAENESEAVPTPEPVPETLLISLSVDEPYISVNGEKRLIDGSGTTPVILNNRTLLPIRAVIEAMGGNVSWDAAERLITLSLGESELKLQIDKAAMWDGEGSYELDCAPVIIGGRTMLPVRAVVEYFGARVSWDAATKTVNIEYPASE